MFGALAISRVRRNVVLLFFCSAALTLVALFVRELVRAPDRTPLFIFSTTYEAPFDINPWVAENEQQLLRLGERNLSVEKAGILDASLALAGIEKMLPATGAIREGVPLLVYFNMHVAVNEKGAPCVIPGNSSDLTDLATWIPLGPILEQWSSRGSQQPIVLFFESARLTGLARKLTQADRFESAMKELLESARLQNAQVCALGVSGASAFNDWTGRGDAFTRILADGLAGSADGSLTEFKDEFVSLHELVHYVRLHLVNWNEGAFATQRDMWSLESPALQAANTKVRVSWCLDSIGQIERIDALPSPAEKAKLKNYWHQLHELAALQPWEQFPGQWANVAAELVAYEAAVFGGAAVRDDGKYEKRLRDHIGWLKGQLTDGGQVAKIKQLHAASRSAWKKIEEDPSWETARQLSKSWQGNQLAVPFLEVLQKDRQNSSWSKTSHLARYARLQAKLYNSLERSSSFDGTSDKKSMVDQITTRQLSIEDQILAGKIGRELTAALDEFELQVAAYCDSLSNILSSEQAKNRALEVGPALATGLWPLTDYLGTNNQEPFKNLHYIASCLRESLDQGCDEPEDLSVRVDELAQWQGKQLRQFSAKLPDEEIATQQAVLEILLRQPSMLAVESSSDESVGDLRLNARQRLLRASHKIVSNGKFATPNDNFGPRANVDNAALDEDSFWRAWIGRLAGTSHRVERRATDEQHTDWHVALEFVKGIEGREEASLPLSQMNAQELDREVDRARLLAGLARRALGATLLVEQQARRDTTDARHQAERLVNSFWALPEVNDEPYFASAAKALMPTSSSLRELARRITQQAEDWSRNARQAFTLQLAWKPKLREPTLSLDSEPRNFVNWEGLLSIVPDGIQAPPSGLGYIDCGQIASRIAIATSDLGKQPIRLPQDAVRAQDTEECGLVFHFRGHRYAQNPPVGVPKTYSTRSKLGAVGETTLLVRSNHRSGRDRTFILDCSSSMVNATNGEVAASNLSSNLLASSKLAAAKVTLLRILESMIGTTDRVSVVLYGHRVADGTVEQGTLRQTKYDAQFPFSTNLQAAEDVEVILPLGRFSQSDYLAIQQRLKAVVPWGQTPLYLAVREALECNQLATSSQDIIIISDGLNYQFNPPADKNPTRDDVIALANDRGARLHLVGFGVPAEEMGKTEEDYQALASKTGGSHELNVFDVAKLAETLFRFVVPEQVRVQLPSGKALIGALNETIHLPAISGINNRLLVQYRGQECDLMVSQGDAMQSYVDRQDRLAIPQLLTNSPTFSDVEQTDPGLTPVQIGVHMPVRDKENLTWLLSLQSAAGQAVSRPQRLVVRITPDGSEQQGTKSKHSLGAYVLACDHFEPGYSWPVARFSTVNWPASAESATVEAWVVNTLDQSNDAVLNIPANSVRENEGDLLPGCDVSHSWSGNQLQLLIASSGSGDTDASPQAWIPRVRNSPGRYQLEQIVAPRTSLSRLTFANQPDEIQPDSIEIGFEALEMLTATAICTMQPVQIEITPRAASVAASTSQTR